MFTGIVTDVGRVVAVSPGGVTRFEIATAYDLATIELGASIAHSGCCLTVVEKGDGRYAVEASAETLDKTTLGNWTVGTEVNLERSLKMGDELGGHLVSGHVDGVATVVQSWADGDSTRFVFEAPGAFAGFVARKGAIALDGVSLTVNEVETANGGETGEGGAVRFGVNIIPHTRQWTTFRTSRPGHRVNFEIDMLARYVARLAQVRATEPAG
jgi:riboflavin synthase